MSYDTLIEGVGSLVSYWPLNDASVASGATLEDKKGSNNLTVHGSGLTKVEGIGDGETCPLFPGTEATFAEQASPHQSVEALFTVELWIWPSVEVSALKCPFNARGGTAHNTVSVRYGETAENEAKGNTSILTAIIGNNTESLGGALGPVSFPARASIEQWFYVVLTVTGTTARFYVNGIHLKRNTLTATGAVLWKAAQAGIRLGKEGNATNFFHGRIAKVAAYSEALSQATVREHYIEGGGAASVAEGSATTTIGTFSAKTSAKAEPTGPTAQSTYDKVVLGTTGILNYWPLNESRGQTARDWAGNNPGRYENHSRTVKAKEEEPNSVLGTAKYELNQPGLATNITASKSVKFKSNSIFKGYGSTVTLANEPARAESEREQFLHMKKAFSVEQAFKMESNRPIEGFPNNPEMILFNNANEFTGNEAITVGWPPIGGEERQLALYVCNPALTESGKRGILATVMKVEYGSTYHTMCTYNGEAPSGQRGHIYVNGVAVETYIPAGAVELPPEVGYSSGCANPACIGANDGILIEEGSVAFNGLVQNISTYSVALTAAEAKAHYEAWLHAGEEGPPITHAGLVGPRSRGGLAAVTQTAVLGLYPETGLYPEESTYPEAPGTSAPGGVKPRESSGSS